MAPPRPFAERKRNAIAQLIAPEADAWVGTAAPDGVAHMVPLSIGWTGASIVLVTVGASPTARNMRPGTSVRLGIGPTRDVVMIEAEVVGAHPLSGAPTALIAAFAQQSGWNPSLDSDSDRYELFELRPRRLQAWREANEINGRTLMRNGVWLDELSPD